jgi:hypothetical protein
MKVSEVSYVSPTMRYDPEARLVIFERRDASTGEVTYQAPSAAVVDEARLQAKAASSASATPHLAATAATAPHAATATATATATTTPHPAVSATPEPHARPAPLPHGALVSRYA